MNKIFLTLIFTLFFSLAAMASVTEEISISVGQQRTADRGRLTIKFVSIVEDSRCPPNAKCVWAGNAKVKLAIAKGKAAPRFVEMNTDLDPRSTKLYGYEIKIENLTQLQPESMSMMDRPLVATISITKIR